MFDPTTEKLIQDAPQLNGLDLDKLPRQFTKTYTNIVSERIRLRGALAEKDNEALQDTVIKLRRIAAVHEAFAVLLPDREKRASAAYVAASAHQTVSFALRSPKSFSHIGLASISPDISATLLFLIAEAHADAAEAAKSIKPAANARTIEKELLSAIYNIARGKLGEIVGKTDVVSNLDGEEHDLGLRAQDALCRLLLRGINSLARQMYQQRNISPQEDDSARVLFEKVRALASKTIEGFGEANEKFHSLYPGPLHLASLLHGLEKNLRESALSRIPTPDGIDENDWWKMIQSIAKQHPYLWRNHRKAVKEDYLERGLSSAISFPTGGGKSMLAQLKIATALLRRERVIFLAPTRALVGQTKRTLRQTFKNYRIFSQLDEDFNLDRKGLRGEVTVMTPESCLIMLSIDSNTFADVGLIVFDECHLLHPSNENHNQRNLDAMLAVLNLSRIAQKADFLLLSAMMKNTQEMSDWINSLTGRKCLALDLNWKPTRQARGCIVYPFEQISALQGELAKAYERPFKTLPKKIKETLLAQPYGLFGLRQTWSTRNREDYAFLKLLTEKLLLSCNKNKRRGWKLTSNPNNTSRALAAAAASAGMKTLVFVQNPKYCESCVRDFQTIFTASQTVLTEKERQWRGIVEEEMGGSSFCYMKLASDDTLWMGAASHHALLLHEERYLHESLFRRPDGINVLFATTTLAQGMNLPSEVVIIAGDRRFDRYANKYQKLKASELLNAAGRAGRAGESAQGIVFLVPSDVIHFEQKNGSATGNWTEQKALFEQADQCLIIDDPLKTVLDRIHEGSTQTDDDAYLLSKLPLREPGAKVDPAQELLSRSLTAFRAKSADEKKHINAMIESALKEHAKPDIPEEISWIVPVSSGTGLPVTSLQQIVELCDAGVFSGMAVEVMEALLNWLNENLNLIPRLLWQENLDNVLSTKEKKIKDKKEREKIAILRIRQLLPIWMSGKPLCELEKAFLDCEDNLGQCKNARSFALKLVPNLAFLASLPGRLLVARQHSSEEKTPVPTVLATLSRIVREGCDSPDSLAMRLHLTRSVSRVAARKHYDTIRKYIRPGHPDESFDETLQRIRNVHGISTFKDHGD